MTHLSTGRRRLLGAAAILALDLVAPAVVLAQDPNSGIVQKAARDWLALVDARNAGAAWNASGAKLRGAAPAQRWAQALLAQREPLGPITQRALASTRFTRSVPGQPLGDYAVLHFRTTFAKRAGVSETVTLEREPDGVWRVVAYSIH